MVRVLLAIFGAVFILTAVSRGLGLFTLHSQGIETTGIVSSVEQKVAYGHQPVVTFRDQSGQEHTFTSPTYYHASLGPRVGQEVSLRYLPSSPQEAVINSFWGQFGTLLEFLLLGLFGVGCSLIPRKKRPFNGC